MIDKILIYLEVLYYRLFKRKLDESVIPKNTFYCYDDNGYCHYYRSYFGTEYRGGIACIYDGYFGFDFLLYDSCKICGVNDNDDIEI